MLLHSVIIGSVLYLLMVYGLKQNSDVAENRSLLIGSIVLCYMLVFGHRLPSMVNINSL